MKDILERIEDSSHNESSHELICRLRDCADEIRRLRNVSPAHTESAAPEASRQLAETVLSMQMTTDKGLVARRLARQVLGVNEHGHGPDVVPITTNGTTRLIPRDEPVFLIRGQDVAGAATVRAWADMAESMGADSEILRIAREHADKMDAWPKKKTADLPQGSPLPSPTPSPVSGADERAVFERALKETYQMVDPFNPPPAGSYARGSHEGIIAALKTIRENFERAAAIQTPPRQQALSEERRKSLASLADGMAAHGWPDDAEAIRILLAQSDAAAPQAVALTDDQIEALVTKYCRTRAEELMYETVCATKDDARALINEVAAILAAAPALQSIVLRHDQRRAIERAALDTVTQFVDRNLAGYGPGYRKTILEAVKRLHASQVALPVDALAPAPATADAQDEKGGNEEFTSIEEWRKRYLPNGIPELPEIYELSGEQREAISWAADQAASYPQPISGESLMQKRARSLRDLLNASKS